MAKYERITIYNYFHNFVITQMIRMIPMIIVIIKINEMIQTIMLLSQLQVFLIDIRRKRKIKLLKNITIGPLQVCDVCRSSIRRSLLEFKYVHDDNAE